MFRANQRLFPALSRTWTELDVGGLSVAYGYDEVAARAQSAPVRLAGPLRVAVRRSEAVAAGARA